MSMRARFVVLSAAILVRAMPLTIGFLVALFYGAEDYANTVLLITAANLCGSLPMLAVIPLVIRSNDDELAIWLASRGLFVGLPLIVGGGWIATRYLGDARNIVFLASYASAIFVFGVAQALLNQRLENGPAFRHAAAITVLALLGGLCGYFTRGSVTGFLNPLAVAMLVGGLLSFASIRLRHARTGRAIERPHIATGALDAMWSGLFGLLVIGGMFAAALRVKLAGDPSAFVAFTLGLQVFSVIIFIPGALSAYFVPRLVRAGTTRAGSALASTVQAYALIALPAFLFAVVVVPLCLRFLDVPVDGRQWVIFALIQFAAVLAALNAAYNQMLVGIGRFLTLALLSLLWLTVLVGMLGLAGSRPVWIASALVIAYAVLVLASEFVCRHVLSAEAAAQ